MIDPLVQATVKALVTLPGGNVVGWPRSVGAGLKPLRDPTGATTVEVEELLNPNTAVSPLFDVHTHESVGSTRPHAGSPGV